MSWRLTGREVHAREEDQRKLVGTLGDRGLEVARPEGRLAGAGRHDDQVRDRIQPASREVAGERVPVGREERSVHEDASPPTRRPEERGQQQVDVDGQRIEERDLGGPCPDDPRHRLAQ